ncbi:hypothetical protein X797_010602 [Metarhizium robertsii]|uniref:Uncharacterized protein n=1 Tax=Metarhizium robertsii TaxID=568076 RepID=A0A0A1UNV1_9HYPO|nr:hypothetical protein X797_010602 [Metarhizium robertsii]
MKDARNANDDDDDEVAEGIALQSDSCMCRGTPEDGGSGVWGLVRLTPQKDFPRRAKEKIRTRPPTSRHKTSGSRAPTLAPGVGGGRGRGQYNGIDDGWENLDPGTLDRNDPR